MCLHSRVRVRSFLPSFVFVVGLYGTACDQDKAKESLPPDDAAETSEPDSGVVTTTEPDVGGESPLTLPPDGKCLGDSLTADEAQSLCQWGTGVLGPEGTVFPAACIDVIYDAGVQAAPERVMADMIVLSQANCIAKLRTSYAGCPYTVGQFKFSVESFHVGNCSGASMGSLVGYKNPSRDS